MKISSPSKKGNAEAMIVCVVDTTLADMLFEF